MFGVHSNIICSGSRLEATICLAVAVLVDQIDEYDLFRLDHSHCGCVRARAWDRARVRGVVWLGCLEYHMFSK